MMDEPSDREFKAKHDLDTLLEAKRIREDDDRMERVRELLKEQRSVVKRKRKQSE